jgi:hypothetical protein
VSQSNTKTLLSLEFYHRTNIAAVITHDGFRNTENYMSAPTLRGVFLSDIPVDRNEGTKGRQLLEITLPLSCDVSEYELIEKGKTYREWCVPAEIINKNATVRLLSAKEALDLKDKRV